MIELNDLNTSPGFFWLTLGRSIAKEMPLEPRTNRICSTHQFSLAQRIQPLRGALRRQQECARVLLLGSVSHDGFRPTHLSRELARHRSMPRRPTKETLSLRLQWSSQTFYSGRCQRESRLAYLSRLRPKSDSDRAASLCALRVGFRSGRDRLRFRFHHHRSLSGALPLGQISQKQGRDKTAHVTGDSQFNPRVHRYLPKVAFTMSISSTPSCRSPAHSSSWTGVT
jgi:hypothetical protein